MSTSFPTALDAYAAVPQSQNVNVTHRNRHQNVEDAIEAIETSVGITDSADTSSLRYQVNQLMAGPDPVSILEYIPRAQWAAIRNFSSTYDCTAAYQAACNDASPNGIAILIPHGLFNINSQVIAAYANTHLIGLGRPHLVLGAGQAAAYVMFSIRGSNFSARNLYLTTANRTHCFKIEPQTAANLTGFTFEDLEGEGLFYMVRADGASDRKIVDLLVKNCKNTAPSGQNAGHFFVDWGIGVRFEGNEIVGGRNSSGYGAADSTNITITGNIERGMEDTVALVEAACQLEDCDGANATITGNTFEHDIWVAGSNGVTVTGNTCRRMRTTVGNADGHNVYDLVWSANKAANIHCAAFGGTPPERIKARFVGNLLSPSGRTINGVALAQSVYAEGTYVTELELQSNIQTSDASTNALQISRSANTEYHFYNNDFGTLAHSVSGSGGGLYERGNRNKVTKTGNGYIEVALTTAPSITLSTWTTCPTNTEVVDVNAEHSSGVFTFRKRGTYRFTGIMTVDPDAAGSEMRFRIADAAGTTELGRLVAEPAQGTGSQGLPFRSFTYYVATDGLQVQLQYYFTGASTQFVVGSGNVICNVQVERLD